MEKDAFIVCRGRRGAWRHVLAVFVVICLGLPATSLAKRHPSSYEVIVAVNERAQTVLVGHAHGSNHTTKLLKVNGFTEITVDGSKATLRDLKKGMMVEVTQGGDADEAAALAASHVH